MLGPDADVTSGLHSNSSLLLETVMNTGGTWRSALTPIATVLLPGERPRVDAAGEGLYQTLHRNSLDDAMQDLKTHRAHAVVISVACCGASTVSKLAQLVREFPRVPAVALLTHLDATTPRDVLHLGYSGLKTLIDVRAPGGWRELRETLVSERSTTIERIALGQLALDLTGASSDCWRFFEALFTAGVRVTTVRTLAVYLQVLPSTLMSRFFRAKLPAPKQYLAAARLVRAAYLFENSGLSVASVSNMLDYSSPQSFGRHVRTILGLTAVQFRQRYTGQRMFEHFREELVLPHLDTLRSFTPLLPPPGWLATRLPPHVM
jgi:AraC-like DNA-binding protein